MKKILFLTTVTLLFFSSCSNTVNYIDESEIRVTLNEIISKYDIWYIDYNSKNGEGEIPFLSIAFTSSFLNGRLYANNNLVDIGKTGNGYGVIIGSYNTFDNILQVKHNKYGNYNFRVVQLSEDKIRLIDDKAHISYDLEGYHKQYFNYNKVFYENIEYFLQEYGIWKKIFTSKEGAKNIFDNENFLRFTSENNTTFYSSNYKFGTNVDLVRWTYNGKYEVADIQGYEDIKHLTLFYGGGEGEKEEFEVKVLDDMTLELYHIKSKTIYQFKGVDFIRYLRAEKGTTESTIKQKIRFKTHRKEVKKIKI